MWNLLLSALAFAKEAWEAFKKKPEPEKVPEPVDVSNAEKYLNPKEK